MLADASERLVRPVRYDLLGVREALPRGELGAGRKRSAPSGRARERQIARRSRLRRRRQPRRLGCHVQNATRPHSRSSDRSAHIISSARLGGAFELGSPRRRWCSVAWTALAPGRAPASPHQAARPSSEAISRTRPAGSSGIPPRTRRLVRRRAGDVPGSESAIPKGAAALASRSTRPRPRRPLLDAAARHRTDTHVLVDGHLRAGGRGASASPRPPWRSRRAPPAGPRPYVVHDVFMRHLSAQPPRTVDPKLPPAPPATPRFGGQKSSRRQGARSARHGW